MRGCTVARRESRLLKVDEEAVRGPVGVEAEVAGEEVVGVEVAIEAEAVRMMMGESEMRSRVCVVWVARVGVRRWVCVSVRISLKEKKTTGQRGKQQWERQVGREREGRQRGQRGQRGETKKGKKHPTQLAGLAGASVEAVSECEQRPRKQQQRQTAKRLGREAQKAQQQKGGHA
jgi:hypothetical protein